MDQTVPAYAAEVADYGRSRDPEPGEGALVKNVRPESPAWDVGIEPGMRVLDCCAAPGGKSRACACSLSTASSSPT